MFEEAVEIIRALFEGGHVNYRGEHFDVESAKLWDLPDQPPPIGIENQPNGASEPPASVHTLTSPNCRAAASFNPQPNETLELAAGDRVFKPSQYRLAVNPIQQAPHGAIVGEDSLERTPARK